MNRKIKGLPELIIHKNQGLEYKLIERIGNVAWYEVRYLGGSVLQGYAVIKIRVRKGGKLPSGRVLTDYEVVSSPIGLWYSRRLLHAKEQSHGREAVQGPSRQKRKKTAQGHGKGQGRIKGANKRIGLGATIPVASPM